MRTLVVLLGLAFMLKYNNSERVGRCVVPEPPLFGKIEVDRDRQTITHKCEAGFRLVRLNRSRQTRKCEEKVIGGIRKYDWTGTSPVCMSKSFFGRSCPELNDPQNGFVSVSSSKKGGKATFGCDAGYVLEGPSQLKCLEDLQWNTDYPTCHARRGLDDLANTLKDKFIDKYAMSTGDSKDGLQAKLSVGKAGLELIFAIDTSSSIGPSSLKISREFVKTICGKFNVSMNPSGGKNGTRISILTFSDKTKTLFELDDPNVRSLKEVNAKIDEIKTEGGGTSFRNLLSKVSRTILRYFGKKKGKRTSDERAKNANRALFILTDAERNLEEKESNILTLGRNIRTTHRFEIFTIGIGTKIQKSFLTELASPPYYEHVFEVKDFESLKKIGDQISEQNVDYGMCGISGNTEAKKGGDAHKGAWPWLGWLSVMQSSGEIITCGGALLCDKWFITLASCVTEKDENTNKTVTLENQINLFLGDHNNLGPDDTELMIEVESVFVHPKYTGERIEHGLIPYDVALLQLGYDNETTPKLNKHVRPLCFPEKRDDIRYNDIKGMMSTYKSENSKFKVDIAGWGNTGKQEVSDKKSFPWGTLMQLQQPLQSDKLCSRRYPDLDTDMFFCAGRVHERSPESCHGDIGGPLMAKTDEERYTFFGLTQKTDGCTDPYKYTLSLYMNILHPDINIWVQRHLRGCNRINEPIPYEEEEEEEVEEPEEENLDAEEEGEEPEPEDDVANEAGEPDGENEGENGVPNEEVEDYPDYYDAVEEEAEEEEAEEKEAGEEEEAEEEEAEEEKKENQEIELTDDMFVFRK